MPNDTITPAVLTWTGGALTASHTYETISPAVLAWTGASVTAGIVGEVTQSVTVPTLDRLTADDLLLSKGGTPALRFMAIWQSVCEEIEAAFEAQQAQITDLTAIVARLDVAEAVATEAQSQAAATASAQLLLNSYVDPTAVLTASNDGAITIAAHDRVYSQTQTVAVSGGSLSGFAPGDYVTVYYNDSGLVGGSVTYMGTTDVIGQTGSVHIVGAVLIPEIGYPPVEGQSKYPPGYIPYYTY